MIPTDITIDPALRPQAEEFIKKTRQDIARMNIEEIQNIIHVFQLRTIELTMQNKALELAQSEADRLHQEYRNLFESAPVGYLLLDEDKIIKKANAAAAAILACEQNTLRKKKLSEFIAADFQDSFYLHYRNVFRSESLESCELCLANKGTLFVQVNSRVINAPDPLCLTAFSAVNREKSSGKSS